MSLLRISISSESASNRRSWIPIDAQLRYEPTVETRNRKELRPNEVATWELRIGRFRVFYAVDEEDRNVSIEAIGFKIGHELFIRGERTEL